MKQSVNWNSAGAVDSCESSRRHVAPDPLEWSGRTNSWVKPSHKNVTCCSPLTRVALAAAEVKPVAN